MVRGGRRRSRSGPVVGVAGLGYMGLATGLAFAHRKVRTVGYDIRPDLRRRLRAGQTAIYESGLPALLRSETRSGRFALVDDWDELVHEADVIFLCLPTPRGPGGGIDLRAIRQGVREAGAALRGHREYRLVVIKSTVVPGTTEGVVRPLLERIAHRDATTLGVASNPEFLAEGNMVRDSLTPERIVVGVSKARDEHLFRSVYRKFPAPLVRLTPTEAELVKYASNAFLALKVTFANEVSRLVERTGGNIDRVMEGVGMDSRVGSQFLSAGPGFGGSCFEKDVSALVNRARELGVPVPLLGELVPANQAQTHHAAALVRSAVGDLRGKSIALLGLAFKAGTDDVRESRAVPIAQDLLRAGARVRAHDPVALDNFRSAWEKIPRVGRRPLEFCSTVEESLRKADAAVIQAAWPLYREWPARWSRLMRRPLVVDLRRGIAEPERHRGDFEWVGLGVAHE
ncbi:MAG: UDP-glucose/GDP-mannose dehydrogenase family protein [Thermoplasmata archaeon]